MAKKRNTRKQYTTPDVDRADRLMRAVQILNMVIEEVTRAGPNRPMTVGNVRKHSEIIRSMQRVGGKIYGMVQAMAEETKS